jgi:hypothetical protein
MPAAITLPVPINNNNQPPKTAAAAAVPEPNFINAADISAPHEMETTVHHDAPVPFNLSPEACQSQQQDS